MNINLKDDRVDWVLQEAVANSPWDEAGRGYFNIDDQQPLRREALDLLLDLQHLLADAALLNTTGKADNPDQDDKRLDNAQENLAKILGQLLYEELFKADLQDSLLGSIDQLGPDELLRVELQFEGRSAAQWSSWPWEYLYIPSKPPNDPKRGHRRYLGKFLADSAQLVLNRKPALDSMNLAMQKPKVLLVISRPWDCNPVECESVVKALQALQARQDPLIELVEMIEPVKPDFLPEHPDPKVTRDKFKQKIIDVNPNVIHFIGHGRSKAGKGSLGFINDGGNADWVDEKDFTDLAIGGVHDSLKLVFLQACQSATPDPHTPMSGVAQNLARRAVPAVVAMQAKVENSIANQFACAFYKTLAESKTIDRAVLAGRIAIKNEIASRVAAFGVPVLYYCGYGNLITLPEKRCPKCNNAIADKGNFYSWCGVSLSGTPVVSGVIAQA